MCAVTPQDQAINQFNSRMWGSTYEFLTPYWAVVYHPIPDLGCLHFSDPRFDL
jgi:hypothetical protein